jgi:hypothetical protein
MKIADGLLKGELEIQTKIPEIQAKKIKFLSGLSTQNLKNLGNLNKKPGNRDKKNLFNFFKQNREIQTKNSTVVDI